MSKDIYLQHLLDEINVYVDDMPAMGSSECLRFTEAVEELLSYREAIAKHPLTPERDHLGRKIDAVLRRHDREKKAYDRVLGSSCARATTSPTAKIDGSKP